MKRVVVSMLGIFAVFCLFALEVDASPTKRCDETTGTCRIFTHKSLWEGFKVFRHTCKSCHHRGNDKHAKFLHTESKTMKGWNRVFAKRYPA